MKKVIWLAFALAVLSLAAVPGRSQTQYRCDLYGAVNIPMAKSFTISTPQSSTPLNGEHSFSPGVRGGIRLGADGRGHWGQDLSYSYGTNPSKIAVPQTGEFSITNRIHQFAYNTLYYPGGLSAKKEVFPYITAGIGAAIFQVSKSAQNDGLSAGLGSLQDHTSLSINAGGGVRVRVNSVWGFRVDVRDYMSHPVRYGIPDSSGDPGRFVFPVKGIFHQIELSIGFNYYFKS